MLWQYPLVVAAHPRVVPEKGPSSLLSETCQAYPQPTPFFLMILRSGISKAFLCFHILSVHQLNDMPGIQSRYIVYINRTVVFLSAYELIHAKSYIRLH